MRSLKALTLGLVALTAVTAALESACDPGQEAGTCQHLAEGSRRPSLLQAKSSMVKKSISKRVATKPKDEAREELIKIKMEKEEQVAQTEQIAEQQVLPANVSVDPSNLSIWGVDLGQEALRKNLGITFAALCASTCGAATGFGEGIIFQFVFYLLSLLGLTSGSMVEANFILGVWSWPVGLVQFFLLREYLNLKLALTMGCCAGVTCVLGLTFLAHHDTTRLKMLFGAFLLVVFGSRALQLATATPASDVAEQADKSAQQVDVKQNAWLVVVTGCACGFMVGLFSSGGPALMVFALIAQVDKDETRASVLFFAILILAPLRVLVLFYLGVVDVKSIGSGLIALPGGLVGLTIGNYITRFLSKTAWQYAVLALLLVSSLFFLLAPVLFG